MKKLKLYESFRSDSDPNAMEFLEENLGRRYGVDVDISRPYTAVKEGKVIRGECKWEARLDLASSGIDGVVTTIKSMSIVIEVEDEETEEYIEHEIEIPNIDPDRCKRYDMYKFPLYLNSIEIDMRNSSDTSFWEFNYTIGTRDL